jgi:hypothetical protein
MERGVNEHGQEDIGAGRGGQWASAAHNGHAMEIITRLKKVNEGLNSYHPRQIL